MSKLIEKMRQLKPEDGYCNTNNPYFKDFTELQIVSAAKECGHEVKWSNYEKCLIIIPH